MLAGLAAVAVLAVTAVGWAGYRNLSGGITTSQALAGGLESVGGAQNILIMGLDSRLDQHGQPLPADIYDALHAGDETVGGYNANVLIVLHLPGGNGPVSAVSVPRDDYVDLPGCPSGVCKGKIKQAYGLAYRQSMDSLSDNIAQSSREQKAREAGRKAEIDTVRRLLGVPIDHFIEVTLGAFFQIAQVVQPITVCLNNDTSDSYSGADFHRGVQQIDAAQAMAFVRQRRDENDQLFTDMDRTRRQQAFVVSLVTALRHGGSLSSPSSLRNLLQVAQQNIAVDDGFDLAGFVDHAASFTDSSLTLYTLPISEFGLGKGVVTRVSSDVATPTEVQATLGETLQGTVVRVELELTDSESSALMDPHLRSGDRVTIRLHRRERRVITLLFDFVRKWVS